MEESNALVPSISIEALLQERMAVVEGVLAASESLIKAERQWEARIVSSFRVAVGGDAFLYRDLELFSKPQNVVRRIDARYWALLMDQSGMRSYMSASARNEWKRQIDAAEVAEFNEANVKATFKELVGNREDLLDTAVLELFQGLSWDYASNSPRKFEQKLVLSGFAGWGFSCICTTAASKLDDLNRVFHLADGKPFPDHRDGMWKTLEACFQRGKSGGWDGPYFTLRWYKTSGACHVTFTRQDLVDKLNRRLARAAANALPKPDRRRRAAA